MSIQQLGYEDAKEVLADAAVTIQQLQTAYKDAANDEALEFVSRTKIKSAVESLRSALEYTAQDIWRSYTKKKNNVYFPYGKDKEKFQASVKKNLPALELQSPALYALVEKLQPHITGEAWLSELCSISNFNKHNGLSKQVRMNSPGNTINIGGAFVFKNCQNIIFEDSYINGVSVVKNGSMIISNASSVKEVREQLSDTISFNREFDWVEFHVDLTKTDALCMLKKAHKEIFNFVESVHSEIQGCI